MSAERSIPIMITAGVGYGTALAAFRYTNGMGGYVRSETDEDEVDRKERERKERRRPLHETIEQLGEGRGALYKINGTQPMTNSNRYLRPWIRRAEKGADIGQVRHRCEGSAVAISNEKGRVDREPLGSMLLYIYFIESATKAYAISFVSLPSFGVLSSP